MEPDISHDVGDPQEPVLLVQGSMQGMALSLMAYMSMDDYIAELEVASYLGQSETDSASHVGASIDGDNEIILGITEVNSTTTVEYEGDTITASYMSDIVVTHISYGSLQVAGFLAEIPNQELDDPPDEGKIRLPH